MSIESNTLINTKSFPAISITLPVHGHPVDTKKENSYINEIINEVESQLLKKYSKEKSTMMMDKVRHVFSSIPKQTHAKSLIVFVSPETEKVIGLPYPVVEKVIVDDSFEVRDLLYAAGRDKNYLLLIITKNQVKTFIGNSFSFVYEKFDHMPDNLLDVMNQHSYPGWEYFDSKSYDEKNLHNYLHFIDEVITKELLQTHMHVIVMGDVKLLGYFRQQTHNSKNIIGFIEGNYENSTTIEIRMKVEPVLKKLLRKEEEDAIIMLSQAVSKNNYAAGISSVWRYAAEGRGRILLVEKDYRVKARFGENNYSIILEETELNPHNMLSDAVDDVMELVLKNNGEIIFMENDSLKDFEHIALITRY